MNPDASTVELPAAAMYVTPAATEVQIASRMLPSVHVPMPPTSPRLMFATRMSFDGSASVA